MLPIFCTVALVVAATLVILKLNQRAQTTATTHRTPWGLSQVAVINIQLRYQRWVTVFALGLLALLYVVNPSNFAAFVGVGNPAAPAKAVALLGISPGESWLTVGTNLSLVITLATTTFMVLQFRKRGLRIRHIRPFILYVLLFSLTNSFAEEVIYRLGVIIPLYGNIDTAYMLAISAIAFGVPHLRGMPNGLVGATMAGILGWVLAKSVVETHGLVWAWTIHFLQDIVIFTGLVLNAVQIEGRGPQA